MKQDQPSTTAWRVALSRAAHQTLDDPKVLDDPVALPIVGVQGSETLRAGKHRHAGTFARYLRAFVVARSRFAEERLAQAVQRGVRQYVILGAGLDTFAYRNPYAALCVFEVDHPSTQTWKRRLLQEAKIPLAESLRFVPVDFETQNLADELRLAGFKTDEPVFFSWLGVTMYLKPETVMATIKHVLTTTPKGSEIVFDYLTPLSQHGLARRLFLRMILLGVAVMGEPMKAFFDSKTLAAELKTLGFAQVDDLSPDDINARYFRNRADGLQTGRLGHFMAARV
jgi:methyltransferase (TIGR00027 family)